MPRILHFADAHIDIKTGGGKHDPVTQLPVRVMDFLNSMDTIVATAIQEKVDLVVFAGDAYKDRSPSPTYLREWQKRVIQLSEAGIPTILVVGNHDLSPANYRAHALEEFRTLRIPNVHVIDRPGLLTPKQLGIPLQVIALPWIYKNGLMASTGIMDTDQLLQEMEHTLGRVIDGLVKKLDANTPAILTAHGAVQGAKVGAERCLSIGAEMSLPIGSLRNPRLDYVALGHIHVAQNMNEGVHPPIIYPGSIERVDFGEKDDKYFVIADVQRGHTTVDWRKLDTRHFVEKRIRITRETENPAQEMIQALEKRGRLEGAVVKMVVEYPKDIEATIDDAPVRKFAEEVGVLELHFVREPEAPQRVRLPDIPVQSLNQLQLLELYLQTIHIPTEGLLNLGKEIFGEADGNLASVEA